MSNVDKHSEMEVRRSDLRSGSIFEFSVLQMVVYAPKTLNMD